MTFGAWLKSHRDTDEATRNLQSFADIQTAANWPYHSTKFSDYVTAIQILADDAQKKSLLDALPLAYEVFLADYGLQKHAFTSIFSEIIFRRPGAALLVVFGLVVAAFLTFGLFTSDFLIVIASQDAARGLITFLVSFTSIAIITLVAIATFWLSAEDLERRFSYAKDIVSIIVGVLGTILGFYFGSADKINDYDPNVTQPVEQTPETQENDL